MTEIISHLIVGLLFFLKVINWLIIIDIILGFLTIFGIVIIIGPIKYITEPLYNAVNKVIPTKIGMIDFSPIIIMILIDLLSGLLLLTMSRYIS